MTTTFDWWTCDDPGKMFDLLKNSSERKRALFCEWCQEKTGEWISANQKGSVAKWVSSSDRFSFMNWCKYCDFWQEAVPFSLRADLLREIFPDPADRICPHCRGTDLTTMFLMGGITTPCSLCNGTGKVNGYKKIPSYWRTPHVTGLAQKMYDSGDFYAMPILADALEEAGCDDEWILRHCRGGVREFNNGGESYWYNLANPERKHLTPDRAELHHLRGCWVCDLILGLE